ncbi:MAG: hypothetical protein V4857_24890 [Pseudomonadota bacterium]
MIIRFCGASWWGRVVVLTVYCGKTPLVHPKQNTHRSEQKLCGMRSFDIDFLDNRRIREKIVIAAPQIRIIRQRRDVSIKSMIA